MSRVSETPHTVSRTVETKGPEWSTVSELLSTQAEAHGAERVYRYLADGETVTRSLTYAELDLQARALGAHLQSVCEPGDRALIMTWDSIDFILAFMACQHARVIAVPAYPPFPLQSQARIDTLRAIVQDSGAQVVLGSPVDLRQAIHDTLPDLKPLPWIEIDEVDSSAADDFRAPAIRPDHISFLQYTSGSTSMPKGVVVTHDALLANERLIFASFGDPRGERGVGWLPLYHDMGLIGYVVQTIYAAGETVLMSPLAFVQRPVRWLKAISHYRAGYSGGPNFAYELCVRRIRPEERAELDLSCWRLAFNGAEPVRAATLDAFAEAFGPCGFDPSAWFPCYGLAESTLIVTGPRPGTGAARLRVQADALQEGRLLPGGEHELIGSGKPSMHRRLEIVDPRSRELVEPGKIGEIWLAGPDVARGYWGNSEQSRETFEARLAQDETDGPFLRTGDLGAVHEGELYVTGRLKDLIIVDGRNHYPQDIEASAQAAHTALRHGCSAAFADGHNGAERVILVAELKQDAVADPIEVERAVRAAVASRHGLQLGEVMLVAAQSVPKTSSGKLQRSACRAAWEAGRLLPVAAPPSHRLAGDPDAVVDWLLDRLAETLRVDAASIPLDAPFVDLGLSSVQAVELSDELQRWTGMTLPPTLIFDYPTIDTTAAFIAHEAQVTT